MRLENNSSTDKLLCLVMHNSISKLISIASDNGLVPAQQQATAWTNVDSLPIGP